MGGVIGGAGGYATVASTRNYIGEAMSSVQDAMFKQNAQRIADNKARHDAEKDIQETLDKQTAKDQAVMEKHPEGRNLGIEQPDILLHNNVLDSRAQYTSAGDILSNPNATPQQRSQAFGIQQSALRSIDEAKDFKTQLGAVIDAARENKGGVYNAQGAKEALDHSLKFTTGQWRLVKDEKGNTKVDTFDVDEEGKFTKATGVGLSFQELLQKYTPPLAYSNEANNIEFKKALPPISEWESADGKKVIKGYQGIEGYAEDNANSVVTNRDKMYGIASAAGIKPQLDLKDYSESDIKKVKAFIVDGFKEKYKSAETNNYTKLTLENKIKQDEINNNNEQIRIKIAKDAAGKENKEIRFTVKDGLLGRETSATMKMSDQEYADYLAKNGVTDVKTMDEVWNDPINAGYAKATKNSPEKTKISKGQVVDGYKYLGGDTKNAKSWKKI